MSPDTMTNEEIFAEISQDFESSDGYVRYFEAKATSEYNTEYNPEND